jgi:chromate transporter
LNDDAGAAGPAPVSFRDALRFWLTLGFINFGGPAGQIAIMHRELVERRRWISEERFLHALNYCMLLPGPEAQQLATYVGWLLHGARGALAAGLLFIVPGALLMLALSWVYAAHGHVASVAALFYGLRAAVVAIVLEAVARIGSKALRTPVALGIAATAFLAMAVLRVPFPAIVLGAGLLGALGTPSGGATAQPSPVEPAPSVARSLRVLAVGLLVWLLPLAGLARWRGPDDVLTKQALFFSKAAMVTFGGAYAVLSYVNQAAVEDYRWLKPGEMVDGLGLAETTPGPLILVLEFVGYLGARRQATDLAPGLAGALGALVTLWATFAPCFLWIFLGAPYVERLRGNARLASALAGITAAVVGVILHLGLWFAWRVLFQGATLDLFALALVLAAFAALVRFRLGIVPVVLASVGAGLARWLFSP